MAGKAVKVEDVFSAAGLNVDGDFGAEDGTVFCMAMNDLRGLLMKTKAAAGTKRVEVCRDCHGQHLVKPCPGVTHAAKDKAYQERK